MKCAHTRFSKGKRLLVTLRDGTRIIDDFVEARSKFIVLRKTGRVMREDLKNVQIPK
jgi:hypothetical protein